MGPQIYIAAQNQVYGPYDFAHVQAGVQSGQVTPQHALSYDGRQWFPASAIWPQLLGQAGFAAPQAAAPMHGAQMPAAGAPQGRVVAQTQPAHAPPVQAQRVPQAAYAATPVHNVPPGVAMAAETVTDSPRVYGVGLGRTLAVANFVMLAGALCLAAVFVIGKLPLDKEFRNGPVPKQLAQTSDWIRAIGFPVFYLILVSWACHAAGRLRERKAKPEPYSGGWTLALFLIPILNVFMPPVVLQTLWKSSDWTVGTRRRPRGTPWIVVWWIALWLCKILYSVFEVSQRLFIEWLKSGSLRPGTDRYRAMLEWNEQLASLLPTASLIEAAVWSLSLGLFIAFDARVRTRVEMG